MDFLTWLLNFISFLIWQYILIVVFYIGFITGQNFIM